MKMIAIRLPVLIAALFELGHSQEIVDGLQFGKQYFLGDGSKSFEASKSYCESHRGQLARVDSTEEETFVKEMVRGKFGANNIGVNAQKGKGGYVWPNGDQARPASSWASGYPQCAGTCCRLIIASTQGWFDYQCNSATNYVCEITLSGGIIGPMNMNVRDFRNWTVNEIENVKEVELSTGRIVNRLAQDNEKTSKYFLTDEVYNISSAKEFCESQNSRLAIVGSQWEEGLITIINRDAKPWIGLERVNGTFFWLGQYDVEYANWNPEATLYTLDELLRMQTEFPANLDQNERLALLNQISEQFVRYRNKWGVEIVECMSVYMESDGSWNVDRCSAMRRGVCERTTWMESKFSESVTELRESFDSSNAEVFALKAELSLQKRVTDEKIRVLETRLENQKRGMQQQIAQLVSDFNEMKKNFTNK